MPPRVVSPRRAGHEYDVDHQGERLVIRTNDVHKNFRLVAAPIDDPSEGNWQELIGGGETSYLRGVECFRDWMVIEERIDGLDRVRVLDVREDEVRSHWVEFEDQAYVARIDANVSPPKAALEAARKSRRSTPQSHPQPCS